MTEHDNALERIGKTVGMHPNEVGQRVSGISETVDTTILRAVFNDRIQIFLTERLNKLRKISTEELRYVQGVADGLELAQTAINEKL